MKTSGRVVSGLFLALLLVGDGAARGATLVYDFLAPGAAGLAGSETGTYTVGGVPLFIEAGSLEEDGVFERGGFGAVITIIQPLPFFGGGLGVLSAIPSGTGLDEGLSRNEGLLFRFSPGFKPTRFTLDNFTYGVGSGGFEAVRIFLNGVYAGFLLGEFDGTVTIPLPAGVTTLALSPMLDFDLVSPLSSDPMFFVVSIEGTVLSEAVLDIKPGSCENPLNVRSRGVLPAAILGTAELDVASIDRASIRLAGVAPLRSSLEDVGTPGDCDAGPDGIPDLVLKFDTEALVRAIAAGFGPIRNRRTVALPLEAKLRDGSVVQGKDSVLLHVPGGKK